ncbi:MAG: hypothetical protein AAGI10_05020 [Pseudomonadota bacterium]
MSDALSEVAAGYVDEFRKHGAPHFISNLETRVALRHWGDFAMPVTINDGWAGQTFLCSPRIGMIEFPKEELVQFPNVAMRLPLRALVTAMGIATRPAQLEKIVHLNNWLLSTNLPRSFDPGLAAQQTQDFVAEFPEHILAMRSLNWRHSAPLMEGLVQAGWILLPARQVFVLDDVRRQSFATSDGKKDARLWDRSGYEYELSGDVEPQVADQISLLHGDLYRGKYSQLNPAYTGAFVRMTHRLGLLRYHVFRDGAGMVRAAGGVHSSGSHCAMPILGYDLGARREEGLYRLVCHGASRYAAAHGLAYNKSSGVGAFKRNRGATAEMEYTAFYIDHLPRRRRRPFVSLSRVARRIAVPLLEKHGL